MIIGIDGNEANVPERVGVSWYVYHVLRQLSHRADSSIRVQVFLREPPREDIRKWENSYFRYIVVPGKHAWSQIALPIALWTRHRDLSVFIAPAHYAPRSCPCPTVVVVHDVSYRYYPSDFKARDLYQLNRWTSYSVNNAAKVVAVSENTKKDVIREYHLDENAVRVVYNGFEKCAAVWKQPAKPTFLFIGTLQPRKNLATILYALKHPLCENYSLLVVGRKGWFYEQMLGLVSSLKLNDRVQIMDYVSNEEKNKLLARSSALVLPGYYEGFGLPMLEAFSAGLPVIAASAGSLPEIGSDACILVPPLAIHAWSQAMHKVCNVRYARNLSKKGKERAAHFSWEKTAKELLAVCVEVFEGRNK